MTPPNVSKADEIFKNWRHTNEPMTEEDLVMELRDYAKSLESSLTQAQGEIERLRKACSELIEKYPKATDVEVELLIYDIHKALV